MEKIDLKIIPSVNWSDIHEFVVLNTKETYNKAVTIVYNESYALSMDFPDEIETEEGDIITKVYVNNLKQESWIKKFTETQEIKEDYYILFTD